MVLRWSGGGSARGASFFAPSERGGGPGPPGSFPPLAEGARPQQGHLHAAQEGDPGAAAATLPPAKEVLKPAPGADPGELLHTSRPDFARKNSSDLQPGSRPRRKVAAGRRTLPGCAAGAPQISRRTAEQLRQEHRVPKAAVEELEVEDRQDVGRRRGAPIDPQGLLLRIPLALLHGCFQSVSGMGTRMGGGTRG